MAAANAPDAHMRVRVYVGGLPADTSAAELQERFSRFVASGNCRLQSVELLPPKGLFALSADATHRGFAYLTLQGEAAAEITEKLVKTYHKTKWRGSVLRVEPAKPDYLERLQQEWQEQREREQVQSAAMAEARGLIAAAQRELGELENISVGGVEFCGKKRTTFDYEDIDFETAFAPKPAKPAVVAVAPVAEQTNGYHSASDDEEMSQTEMESSGEEQQEDEGDDDADYWATSGDESEKAGDVGEEDQAEPSAASDDADENDDESEETESEDDEIPAEDAVAVDDVEAFVQQMLEQEQEEATQPSVSAITPEKKDKSSAKATKDGTEVNKEDVDEYVQQVEREEANAKRIAALEAKMKQKQEKQQAAVVKIDFSAKSNKKITFDDSGNEQEENDNDDDAQGNDADGNGGSAITNWLDSSDDEGDDKNGNYGELRDGSDDEDDDAKKRKKRNAFEFLGGDDDNEDAKAFAVRPEFLGERGKKLFELQKRFGGDQRFRMDARFIEDEENEYGGTDGLLPDDDDDQVIAAIADGPVGELQEFQDEDGEDQAAANEREWLQEQDLALSVIAELFPDMDVENIKYKLRVKIKKDPIKEASWMGQMMRYDPRDIHARHAYEIPLEDKKSKQQNSNINEDGEGDSDDVTQKSDADSKKKVRDEKEVLIGGDRFFSTSSALGSLFTRVRKNSEDGIAGEAALDGVFGFSRGFDDTDAATNGGDAADKSEDVQGAGGATFKLSSLFDFPVEEEKEKNSRLAAMGEKLFEEDNDDGEEKPWHFTQSFFSEDVHMDTDNEDEDDDGGDDADEVEAEDEEQDGKKKPKKKVLKKSLTEFLEFGKSFVCPQDGSTNQKSKEWTEKRKRLTLDFKRKRKDALRNKKKIQQRLAKQHQNKKQKTIR